MWSAPDAPFYHKIAEAPEDGRAFWITAEDGVRLRIAAWRRGLRGTVVLFPGRTEFAEKYGRTVADLVRRDFAAAVIDWRGQGLSDRLTPNRKLGHVGAFADYQMDVHALWAALVRLGMPEPFFLVSHSMGGTIALRSLQEGLTCRSAVFFAPMWGINMGSLLRPLALGAAASSRSVGLGLEFSPGTGPQNYLATANFAENTLTSSREGWDYMQAMAQSHPGLEIGGPSIHWVHEALAEIKTLMAEPAPDYPALAIVGSHERVVQKSEIHAYMDRWPGTQTLVLSGAEHEILMEAPQMQARALAVIDAFFAEDPAATAQTRN